MFRNALSPVLARTGLRSFHASRAIAIAVGDAFPDIEVLEDSPGNKVALASELKKQPKAIVIGVPAAFSPACSAAHIPGYINAKSGLPTYVISVNDPFVMKAWGASIPGSKDANFRFLADPTSALTNALQMDYDGVSIFGSRRSRRYALVVDNGEVAKIFVEPDNTGVKESTADRVLAELD